MMELDGDVMGGCYPRKDVNWDRVKKICRRSEAREYTVDEMQVLGGGRFNFERPPEARLRLDTPQEVEFIGAGLLMVKRGVFEKLRAAHPDRWYESRDHSGAPLFGGGRVHDFFRAGINSEHKYLGEDYTFCADCRAVGFK